MKKSFSILSVVIALALTFSIGLFPKDKAYAEIVDGTYEINYEMKEAGSENTSIADGYFTKPATLTVENGEQHVQLMITSSSMVQSLSAPSGSVDIVNEDESEDTRTVKFRVDGDLSKPVEMEMHIIVPDLYDMTHTARAVFDTSGLDRAAPSSESGKREDANNDNQKNSEEEQESNETEENTAQDDTTNNEENEVNNNEENENNEEENENEGNNNEDEEDVVANDEESDEEEEESKSSALWITLSIVGMLIIVVVVYLIVRKRGNQ